MTRDAVALKLCAKLLSGCVSCTVIQKAAGQAGHKSMCFIQAEKPPYAGEITSRKRAQPQAGCLLPAHEQLLHIPRVKQGKSRAQAVIHRLKCGKLRDKKYAEAGIVKHLPVCRRHISGGNGRALPYCYAADG